MDCRTAPLDLTEVCGTPYQLEGDVALLQRSVCLKFSGLYTSRVTTLDPLRECGTTHRSGLIKDIRVYVEFQLVEQPHLGSMRTCGTTYRSGIIEEHNRVPKLILPEDIVVPTTVTLLGGDIIVKKRVTRTTRWLFPEGSLALLSGNDINGVKSSYRKCARCDEESRRHSS